MPFNTRKNNIYGLGVWISTVFNIFSNFLSGGGGIDPVVMTYIPVDAP
jgi:hypothetical protein